MATARAIYSSIYNPVTKLTRTSLFTVLTLKSGETGTKVVVEAVRAFAPVLAWVAWRAFVFVSFTAK